MKRSLATAAICGAFWCSALAAETAAPAAVKATLAPGKIHEECMRLEAGDKRKYHWKSSAPVDFNIHYHKGSEVFFPVKHDGKNGFRSTFTAKTGEDYCWMWTAKDKEAVIEGEIR
jgi:hypothetical protein